MDHVHERTADGGRLACPDPGCWWTASPACPRCLMPMARSGGRLVHADPADADFCSISWVDDGVQRDGS